MTLFRKPRGARVLLAALTLFVTAGHLAPASSVHADELEDAFFRPPQAARPLVYWFWMGKNVTREGITGDLEALKSAGFGGTTMCNLADVCTPWSGAIANSPLPDMVPYVSDDWWEMLHFAASESHRLGLEFGFHNCPGYESNGGPWITPEYSMQEICFSQTPVDGGSDLSLVLPRPTIDPHAQMSYPVLNEDNGKVEKPLIPARQTYFQDIAVLALPAEGTVASESVIDLSSRMTPDGHLQWTAPPGRWIVYRFGHTTRGTLIQPAPWKATGLECDKMNPDAVAFHMNHILGELKKHCGDVLGKGLDFLWFDSYEAGTPNWTPKMREEFQARRSYPLTPFLATFAKRVIGSDAETKKFKADFQRTIFDLYRDVDFAVSEKLAHAAGLQLRSEPYGGPWTVSEVIPHFDQVAGEFWNRGGRYSPYAVTDVVQGAALAHQNIITAEAFTAAPGESLWNETPYSLKTIGDAAFCDGVNRMMLHRYTHQPFGEKYKPGIVMGQWGTHFDRTQTWWVPGKAWVGYLHRCQALLQWGERVSASADFKDEGTGEAAAALKAIHRRGDTKDLYFVANPQRSVRSAPCSFAVTGRQPELWDPVTGTVRDLPDFSFADGRTTIPLTLDAAQSAFIIFRKPIAAAATDHPNNFPAGKPLTEIAGTWRVTFNPHWGGPADEVPFPSLIDWTQRPEKGIRYYSGTATYRITFDRPADATPNLSIDLGVVHDLARVRINGTDLGVVWTAPWRIALPATLLQPHGNTLEIEVTNCWANRLIGDEQEPADCQWTPGHQGHGGYLARFPDWFVQGTPRPSQGRYTFTTWNYFTPDSKLQSAGLIGPVHLIADP